MNTKDKIGFLADIITISGCFLGLTRRLTKKYKETNSESSCLSLHDYMLEVEYRGYNNAIKYINLVWRMKNAQDVDYRRSLNDEECELYYSLLAYFKIIGDKKANEFNDLRNRIQREKMSQIEATNEAIRILDYQNGQLCI